MVAIDETTKLANDLPQVEKLFADYVRALDDRRFSDWLRLLSDDAFYGVVRSADYRADNNLFILGETKDKLRNRIDAGVELDRAMQIHLLSGLRIDEHNGQKMSASANFAVLRDGAITYAGQYQFSISRAGDGSLSISRCVAVVMNERPSDLLYLPI